MVVAGSSAGWLVVVDLTKDEDEAQVLERGRGRILLRESTSASGTAAGAKIVALAQRRAVIHPFSAPGFRSPAASTPAIRPRRANSPPQNRYQIHSCGVSAVDLSSSGELVVSGGVDGGIVVWSSVTGFTLQCFTLHRAAMRSLRFNTGALATPRAYSFGG
jgi:WD40 repeat protein